MKYKNKPESKDVSSINNLSKKQELTYVINLDECKSLRTHWIALFVNGENVTYFDSFGVLNKLKSISLFF